MCCHHEHSLYRRLNSYSRCNQVCLWKDVHSFLWLPSRLVTNNIDVVILTDGINNNAWPCRNKHLAVAKCPKDNHTINIFTIAIGSGSTQMIANLVKHANYTHIFEVKDLQSSTAGGEYSWSSCCWQKMHCTRAWRAVQIYSQHCFAYIAVWIMSFTSIYPLLSFYIR